MKFFKISILRAATFICLFSLQSHAQNQARSQMVISNFKLSNSGNSELIESVFNKAAKGALLPLDSKGKSGADIGGGKVLVCKSQTGKAKSYSIEMLDLFEGRKDGYKVDFGQGGNMLDKIDHVLQRLSKVAPTRAYVYRKWIYDYLIKPGELQSDEGLYVPNVDDLGVFVAPKNCHVVQVVGQRDMVLSLAAKSRYLVNIGVLELLDQESLIALIFHEIIYREARQWNIRTSESVRALTAILLSNDLNDRTTEYFNELLSRARMQCPEIPNVVQSCLGVDVRKERFQEQQRILPTATKVIQGSEGQFTLTGKFLERAKIGNSTLFSIEAYSPIEINSLISYGTGIIPIDKIQYEPNGFSPINIEGAAFGNKGEITVFVREFTTDYYKTSSSPNLRAIRGERTFLGINCGYPIRMSLEKVDHGTFMNKAASAGLLPATISKGAQTQSISCTGLEIYEKDKLVRSVPSDLVNHDNSFTLVFVDEGAPIISPWTSKSGVSFGRIFN